MARLALPDPPLRDDAITLRGFESSDVAALVEICQDPEIPCWTLVPRPFGEPEARAYLARVADGLANGTRASLAIVDANDRRMLGMAGLMAIDRALACGELGYMLGTHARGRDAASCAVAARTGFSRVAAPVVQHAETAHFPDDIFFARLRDAPGG